MGVAERYKEKNKNNQGKKTGVRDRMQETQDKVRLEQRIGFDTLQSDYENLINRVNVATSDWHTQNSMDYYKSELKNMNQRMKGLDYYLKKYGDGSFDVSQNVTDLNNILSNWDALASDYGKYENRDEYAKAMADLQKQREEYEAKRTTDLDALMKEITTLKEAEAKVKEYEDKLQGLNNRKKTFESRSRGMAGGGQFDDEIKEIEIALSEYISTLGYSDMESYRKAIVEKEQYYNLAKRIQDFDSLSNNMTHDAKFQSYAELGYGRKDDKIDGQYSEWTWANPVAQYRDTLEEWDGKGFMDASFEEFLDISLEHKAAKYMTDEQFHIYNAYIGKGDMESARKYLEVIEESLTLAMAEDMAGKQDTLWKKLGFSVKAGLDQFNTGISQAFANLIGNGQEGYITPTAMQMASGIVRESLGDSGPQLFGNSLGQIVYDFGTTTSNMLPSILTSVVVGNFSPVAGAVVGSTMMGASASGNAYQEMINLGYNKEQALSYSIMVGVSEAALQYALGGIGKLGGTVSSKVATAIAKGTDKAIGQFAIKLGTNVLSEGFEEALQEILTPFFENLALGYQKNNLTDIELEQVAYSGMLGMLSAFFLEGGSTALEVHGQASTGKQINASGNAQTVFDLASLSPEESEAYKLYTEYANRGVNAENVSNVKLGELYNTMESEYLSNAKKPNLLKREKVEAQKKEAQANLTRLRKTNVPKSKVDETVASLTKGRDTVVTKTGESVSIKDVKVEDGKITVVTENGEVSADDVTFDYNNAELVAYAKEMPKELRQIFAENYDGNSNVDDYMSSFSLMQMYVEKEVQISDILEHKGVLTEKQIVQMYPQMVKANRQYQQNAINTLAEKHANAKEYKGTVNDSAIDYTNTTTEKGRVRWSDLNENQRKGVTFASVFFKGLGVDAEFVTYGREKGFHGAFMPSNGKILIDVYAGISKMDGSLDTIVPTASHELLHWAKYKAPMKFQDLSDGVFRVLEKSTGKTEEQLIKEEMDSQRVSEEEARDDIVARACEDMLAMGELGREILNGLSETERKTLLEKLKGIIKDIVDWVDTLLKEFKSKSKEAEILRGYKEELLELSKKYDAMLREAREVNKALKEEGVTAEKYIEETLGKMGLGFDSKTQTVYHSYRSLEDAFNFDNIDEFLKAKEECINALAKTTGKSKKQCERYLNGLFLVHDLIGNDRARLDYEAAINKSSWVSNSEYGGSIDFSTLCAKRRLFTGTFDAIQEALPNAVFTDTDYLTIRDMLVKKGLDAPCSMCYVEGSRVKHSVYVKEFLDEYLKTNPEWKPQIADFTSTNRLEKTRLNHPEAYKAYVEAMNKLAQRKPKEASVRTDYKGEILVAFEDGDTVTIKNKNGGIRFNSFSDFEVIHALDCMQVITDMARVGLAGQGYTKVKEFAECFGNTGLKINLSLVAKAVDSKGRLIFDEVNGMKYDEAMELRNKYSKNVGTVIVVFDNLQLKAALSDSTIDYVLPFHRSQWKKAQYTLMGLPTTTKVFTNVQNDRIRNPKTGRAVKLDKIGHISKYTNDITGESYEIKGNIMPNQYWDYSVDGVANANRYLDYINTNKMIPKFHFLLEKDAKGNWILPVDNKGNVTEVGKGYFKLLIDFKMYDNDGVGSPQTPVIPDFNMPYTKQMLAEYKGGHASFPVANDVVDKFVKQYKKAHKGDRLSAREDYAPTFYSHMERVISDVKQSKLGADSVIPYLKGKGVKDEEIKWSGIETFLEGKKSVTKAELEEFAKGNQLEIEEKQLSDVTPEGYEELYDLWKYHFYEQMSGYEFRESLENADADVLKNFVNEEYENEYLNDEERDEIFALIDKVYASGVNFGQETSYKQYSIDGGSNYRELLFKMPNSDYSSSHWEEEGVLAHARMQDFETYDGKILFIEEIQSDWHNDGMKGGYQNPNFNLAEYSANRNKQKADFMRGKFNEAYGEGVYDEWREQDMFADNPLYKEHRKSFKEWDEEFEETFPDERKKGNTPDAPFKNTYHEYVLKRLIRMASEEGYDLIGWTTGAIQEDRWSSEYAEGYRIEYDQDIPKFLRKYGKKWGAEVGKTMLHNGYEVWKMDITDAMRNSVLYEGQARYSRREGNTASYNGKEFWSGSVNLADGVIEEIHTYEEARNVDFHHSLYFSPEQVDKMDSEENAFFFVDNGKVEIWRDDIPKGIIRKIEEQITIHRESKDIRYSRRETDSLVEEWFETLSAEELGAILGSDFVVEEIETKNSKPRYNADTSTKGKVAKFTSERIERLLREYGARNEKYAQAYVTSIHPRDFLSLTQTDAMLEKWDMASKEGTNRELFSLDIEKLQNETQTPYLIVDTSTGEVKQHEGRHRMRALLEAGVTEVPIAVIDYNTKYSKQKTNSMRLTSQDFGYGAVNDGFSTEIKNLIPTNAIYRDDIVASYGGDGDIRFSRREESVYDTLGESERLDAENKAIAEDVERLNERKKISGAIKISASKVKSAAKHLLNISQSNYSENGLTEDLTRLFTDINTSTRLTMDSLLQKCFEVAHKIVSDRSNTKPSADYFKAVLREIRNGSVSLSEKQIADAKNLLGEDYRNALLGTVVVSKNGTTLDQKWSELSEKYPTIFKEDVPSENRVSELVSISESLRESTSALERFNELEDVRQLAVEIYNQYWNVTAIADANAKIKKINFEHRKAMSQLRKDYNDRLENQKKADAIHYGKIIRDIREKRDERLKEARQFGRRRLDEYKEKSERKAKIQKITKNVKALKESLDKNAKDKHIAEELKAPVRALLNAIDYRTKPEDNLIDTKGYGESLANIEQSVGAVKNQSDLRLALARLNDASMKDSMLRDYGVDFEEDIEKLTKSIEAFNIKADNYFVLRDMDLKDLESLDRIVTQLKTVITGMDKFRAMLKSQSVSETVDRLYDWLESLGDSKEHALQKALDFFNYENIDAIHFFDRLGPVGQEIFNALRKSDSKMMFLAKEFKEFIDKTWKPEEATKWSTDVLEFEITDHKGNKETIYMTTSRLMSLYLLSKREQAKVHLYEGSGGRITSFKNKKGKFFAEYKRGVLFTPEMVEEWCKKLDPRAKEVADAISGYLNGKCKELGNEVTYDLYGIYQFLEDAYFPIKVIGKTESLVESNGLRADNIFALLNKGFTKPIKHEANNQIVIDDIFKVFAKHTSEMFAYNSYGREIYDIDRIFNYESNTEVEERRIRSGVQNGLEIALGEGAVSYFKNLLLDINGSQQVGRGNGLLGKAFSNYKFMAVANSISVALLQPISYIRSLAVLDAKYFAIGMNIFNSRKGYKEALKHSGIALRKSFGFYTTDIAMTLEEQFMNNPKFSDKVKEKSMWLASKGDELTMGALWNACESYVLDKNKGMTRESEGFYDKVVEKYEDVVYRTQVVDSVLTRTQIMRHKSDVAKGLTSFMAEPSKWYNVVYGLASEWHIHQRQGHSVDECRKKYGKRIALATVTFALSTVTEAALRTLVTKMRHAGDEDDDDENIFIEQLLSQLNPLSYLPIFREFASSIEGYGVSDIPGLGGIEYFTSALKQLKKMIFEGEEISYKKIFKILQAISFGTGQGVSNAYRDVIAIWNSTIGQVYPSLIIRTDE